MVREILYTVLAVFMAGTAMAEAPQKTPEKHHVIQAVETYFNTLTTFQAQFTETQPSGLKQEGTFYLQRPKKFLWHYTAPAGQKVVSTGSRLFYIEGDDDFAQVTQLPLNYGLAAVLTKEKLDLADPALHFQSAAETEAHYILTFAPASEDDALPAGKVSLVVTKSPRQLHSITSTDAFGTETTVTFTDIQQGQTLAKKLFNYVPAQEEDFLLN